MGIDIPSTKLDATPSSVADVLFTPVQQRLLAWLGTERANSDIDLLVIASDLDYAQLYEALPNVEAALGR